ncbi:EF-hand and coiled-coil domain-containing protein 1 [Tachyglossus aculeatus]|uniref:EF-hand and coiled-coil domain-containing protein 1 n=1 Tax=Tachyglossus aculeatus TaxID=9261 RepID=UPI0018F506CE|nr:EF-hand and coiled-coil domain-containing protein 1 [Tachyglossus aculeatus]
MEPGPPDAWDPYRRPARRTQWLVSALAHHYRLDRGVENEIVVLATGLDQYLQEVFHHLDCRGDGRLPGEDFRMLCRVLGLRPGAGKVEGGAEEEQEREKDGEEEEEEERAALWDDLAPELTFRQFHARLCGYFSTRAGPGASRLPVGPESEHIETQIRLRSPLRRRRDRPGATTAQAEDRMAKLEEENASLRELVEDMRAALQSSDARCLALQVGLWKSHASHKKDGSCFLGNGMPLSHNKLQTTKGLQSILKEVELIRSSRDEQIEEAIRINRELEKELKQTQEALATSEDHNRLLKREQAEMRKKVEEARQTVLSSLGKVKKLEARANKVPHLQICIQQLESEVQYYRTETEVKGRQQVWQEWQPQRTVPEKSHRSEIMRLPFPSKNVSDQKERVESHDRRDCSSEKPNQDLPMEGAGIADNVEDQMFRSVEGQAASDEEEEKWTGEQQLQVAEMKKLLARLSCCGSGCDDKTAKKLMTYFGNFSSSEHENAIIELMEKITKLTKQLEWKGHEAKKLETNMEETPLLGELQQKVEEAELLKMELQMLETERVRLSLVEEKLMDVLQLLQQLQDLEEMKLNPGTKTQVPDCDFWLGVGRENSSKQSEKFQENEVVRKHIQKSLGEDVAEHLGILSGPPACGPRHERERGRQKVAEEIIEVDHSRYQTGSSVEAADSLSFF